MCGLGSWELIVSTWKMFFFFYKNIQICTKCEVCINKMELLFYQEKLNIIKIARTQCNYWFCVFVINMSRLYDTSLRLRAKTDYYVDYSTVNWSCLLFSSIRHATYTKKQLM